MSMKLGYDLTIEQAQKLVMTPELIQAIQILQFNTQELDAYVEEQLLVNPVLEHSAAEVSNEDSRGDHEESFRDAQNQEKTAADSDRDDFDWKEYIRDRQYDDISYKQGEYTPDEEKNDPLGTLRFVPM